MIDIIKYFFIFIFTTYICLRIMNYSLISIWHKIFFISFSFILSGLTYFIHAYIVGLTYALPLLLFWIAIGHLTLHPRESFTSTVLSFGISYALNSLSSCVVLVLIFPFYSNPQSFPYGYLTILTIIFQTMLIIFLFRIKRFRKGMPFLFSTTFINVATVICILLITTPIYISSTSTNSAVHASALFLFVISLALLIYWWQSQITKSYRRALLLRELESLRTELEEKDKRICELTSQNEQLGRLIHKDNKLIPALENAVCDYLTSEFTDSKSALEKGNSLLLEVKNLSNNRTNILSEICTNKSKQFSTGVPSLDTLLNYMDKRAAQSNIFLSVHIALKLSEFIPCIISSDDFVHVLSDLLENAFIATEKVQNRIVRLQFYQVQKFFVIETADNGIPFETTSLVNMGLVQLTTHATTGGSGIGLMDIWEIKEKYAASLNVREYETPSPYSKTISLIFNKKNQYSVETWRKEEITQMSKRSDLLLYDYKEQPPYKF